MNGAKINLGHTRDNVVSSVAQVEVVTKSLWGGYFSSSRDALSSKILSSISYDNRLYSVAIESMKAQMRMCLKRNIVPEHDAKRIIRALDKLKKEIIAKKIVIGGDSRNIYTFLESCLDDTLGEVTNYLKIARSSGEQYSGDLRLWMRDACDVLDSVLQNLQAALIDKAEENVKMVVPSYVHNQVGPPVSLGHKLLSYVEMFGRDRQRFREARVRLNKSPFGAYMGVGTALHISREMTSKALGFDGIVQNALDAVTDRDFAIDFTAAVSTAMMHITRMVKDLIHWQSPYCNFISFSKDLVTQDHVVPNRYYPEILEVVRAKIGRVYGNMFNIMTIMKSLDNDITQDLQEVSEPVFDSYDTLFNSINIMAALTADFIVYRKEFKEAAQYGYSTAYDLMDWLIGSAEMTHERAACVTRQIIKHAMQKNKKLSLLELGELQEIDPKINEGIYSVFISSRAVISRRSAGGTNPVKVRKAIRAARREYM